METVKLFTIQRQCTQRLITFTKLNTQMKNSSTPLKTENKNKQEAHYDCRAGMAGIS